MPVVTAYQTPPPRTARSGGFREVPRAPSGGRFPPSFPAVGQLLRPTVTRTRAISTPKAAYRAITSASE